MCVLEFGPKYWHIGFIILLLEDCFILIVIILIIIMVAFRQVPEPVLVCFSHVFIEIYLDIYYIHTLTFLLDIKNKCESNRHEFAFTFPMD